MTGEGPARFSPRFPVKVMLRRWTLTPPRQRRGQDAGKRVIQADWASAFCLTVYVSCTFCTLLPFSLRDR
jgi:hypothetical protein